MSKITKLPSPKLSNPKLSLADSTKNSSKETIYIDVEDEITGIIDKIISSKSNIIAVVLPKRATVMQSLVNMKLMKKTAEDAGKHVVLITSEASLMPLAGMAGMYVAATPTSKPSIPTTADMPNDEAESVDEALPLDDKSITETEPFNPEAEAHTPIGVLTAKEPESILMSDAAMPEPPLDEPLENRVAATTETIKPNKKLKVPSFRKFRLGLVLLVLLVAFIGAAAYAALVVLPKAGVALTTNSSTINSNLNLTLDTTASSVNVDQGILPAVAETTTKTYSQEVPTTGQQNNGTKANGSVVLSTQVCAPNLGTVPSDLPAGSGVSSGSYTYITQQTGKYTQSGLSGSCVTYTTQSIDIVALNAGTAYNMPDGTSFTATDGSSGTGSTSGGTDNIVKVVSAADIDAAKSKIGQQDTSGVQQTLEDGLKAKGLLPVSSTFLAGDQQITPNAKVGDQADTVKVTSAITYTELGIKADDMKAILLKQLAGDIDTKKQNIADYGIETAQFSQQTPGTVTSAVVLARVKTVIGPKLDPATIRAEIEGKKSGDIEATLKQIPGVTDVKVMYSPFWVDTAPKDPKKITLVIDGQTR